MNRRLILTSYECRKVKAVLHWTIDNAREVFQQAQLTLLQSDYFYLREIGFGASSLRFGVHIKPNTTYSRKKPPRFLGVFLEMSNEDGELEAGHSLDLDYSVRVILRGTDNHATIAESDGLSQTFRKGASVHGNAEAIAYSSVFVPEQQEQPELQAQQAPLKESVYISHSGALILRVELDIDFEPGQVDQNTIAVCKRLKQLYRHPADFELVSSDQKVFCVHYGVLAAHSSVFQGYLNYATKEASTRSAPITEVDGETLDILLKFIYSGEVVSIKGREEKVLQAADMYEVMELRDVAVDRLCQNLTPENAYRVLRMALRRNLLVLKKKSREFIVRNLAEMEDTAEFQDLKDQDDVMFEIITFACAAHQSQANPQ